MAGKLTSGARELAVFLAHFTSTPRPVIDRYTISYAVAERDAAYRVIEKMNGARK